jgi:hypothetical protein
MKKTVIIIALGILMFASIGLWSSGMEPWEESEEERHSERHESGEHERSGWLTPREDVAPAQNATYLSECGGCHFAYQPGLLPASAWERVMGSLGEHYGDDASLDEQQAIGLLRYLTANAADRAGLSRSRAFASGPAAGDMLPRITDTPYFRREHDEIPPRLVLNNEAVGSFSNCQACHRNAETGIYNEHQVVIPGVGRWDD